jgi:hypothetical protein
LHSKLALFLLLEANSPVFDEHNPSIYHSTAALQASSSTCIMPSSLFACLLPSMLCRPRALQQFATTFPYPSTAWDFISNTYPLKLNYTSSGGSNVCFSLLLKAGTILDSLCTAQQGWGLYSANVICMGLEVGGYNAVML